MSSRTIVLVCFAIMSSGLLHGSGAAAISCQSVADCDDGNECTQNLCVGGSCVFPDRPAGTACADDGNDCTRNLCLLSAEGLVCQHPSVPFGSECADDGNECTRDACVPGPDSVAICGHNAVPYGSA
ncbi:MAG: hypothetical protein ABI629_18075 [bacterium]